MTEFLAAPWMLCPRPVPHLRHPGPCPIWEPGGDQDQGHSWNHKASGPWARLWALYPHAAEQRGCDLLLLPALSVPLFEEMRYGKHPSPSHFGRMTGKPPGGEMGGGGMGTPLRGGRMEAWGESHSALLSCSHSPFQPPPGSSCHTSSCLLSGWPLCLPPHRKMRLHPKETSSNSTPNLSPCRPLPRHCLPLARPHTAHLPIHSFIQSGMHAFSKYD